MVNTGSDNVSVIDAERNAVVATIGVHATPYFISVSEEAGVDTWRIQPPTMSLVIDLLKRVVLGNVRVGVSPGLARVSPDGGTVVVSNRSDGTVSLIHAEGLKVRATIPVCQQPTDIAILPDSSKAFVACTGAAQVASIDLKSGKLMALLDVGKTPVHLALKPDGGELIVCNSDSDSISIIETSTDEVGESHLIGTHPVRALVTADNARLYVSDSGSNTIATYDIDAGTLVRPAIPPVGGHPDGLALSASQNYLLVVDDAAAACPLRGYSPCNQSRHAAFRNVAPYLDCHYCVLATLPAGSGGTIRRGAEDTLGLLPRVNVNLHRAAAIRPRGGMQCAGDTAGWRRHKARQGATRRAEQFQA